MKDIMPLRAHIQFSLHWSNQNAYLICKVNFKLFGRQLMAINNLCPIFKLQGLWIMCLLWYVLLNGISAFGIYLIPGYPCARIEVQIFKPSLGDLRVSRITKSISPKVNVIAWRAFEHVYFVDAVYHFRDKITTYKDLVEIFILWQFPNLFFKVRSYKI